MEIPPLAQKILDLLGIAVESAANKATALSESIGLGDKWNAEMRTWIQNNVTSAIGPILVEALIADFLKIMRGEPTGYWKDAGGSI